MSTSTSRPSSVAVNPVAALTQFGQSVWLDYIRRSLITSGELKRLVDEDGLGGVTSNPAIFEKAIDGSDDYDGGDRRDLDEPPGLDAKAVYERARDQGHPGRRRRAAPRLRQHAARATATSASRSRPTSPTTPTGTLAEARRLWKAVDRART